MPSIIGDQRETRPRAADRVTGRLRLERRPPVQGQQDDGWRSRSRSGLTWHATLVAAVAYTLYAVFVTWPLATDPGGLLPGSSLFGDVTGSAAQVGYVVSHHIFPFAPATFHALNAPQGLPQSWVENWASFPSTTLIYGLGYAFGAVAGSALFLWLSFVLSGVSMFLLTRRLFGSAGAAFLAGFAFAFCPFAVNQITAHDIYMDGFVLVLAVWRMLELADHPTRRNALLGGAATAFAMWWTPYFILIAGVAFVAMALVVFAVGAMRGQRRASLRLLALSTVPFIVLLGSIGALTVLAGGAGGGQVRTQSINQLFTYSIHGLEWLLPDRNNLIFGGLTRGYLTSHLDGSNFGESSLYVGLSVLVLALAGAVSGVRAVRTQGRAAARDIRVIAAIAGIVLALAAALFSAPPNGRLGGIPFVFPSGVIFEFTSTWRVYSRFVELLELGLCIPMAFAVSRLLARRSGRGWVAAFAALCIVVALDMWARPPVRTVSAAAPAEYVWLRDHPGGIVADYPLEPAAYPGYTSLFWQTFDGHPLFQSYAEGSDSETEKLGLADLRSPRTAPILAALGVRYIVVHPGQPGGDPASLERLHYVLSFASSQGSVWQVRARPPAIRVVELQQFSTVAGPPGGEYRWMTGAGVLGVVARDCPACRGELRFRATSNGVTRRLVVTDQLTGAVLGRAVVPHDQTVTVRVPDVALRHGQARLVLSTDVPPTWPQHPVAAPESITVGSPAFTVARSPR